MKFINWHTLNRKQTNKKTQGKKKNKRKKVLEDKSVIAPLEQTKVTEKISYKGAVKTSHLRISKS